MRVYANYRQSMNFLKNIRKHAATSADIDTLSSAYKKKLIAFLDYDFENDKMHGGFAWLGDAPMAKYNLAHAVSHRRPQTLVAYYSCELVAGWVVWKETENSTPVRRIMRILRHGAEHKIRVFGLVTGATPGQKDVNLSFQPAL
jgi:hypothetical protein